MNHRLAIASRRTACGLGLLLLAGCGDAPSTGPAVALATSPQAPTIAEQATAAKPPRARPGARARKSRPADFLDPRFGK